MLYIANLPFMKDKSDSLQAQFLSRSFFVYSLTSVFLQTTLLAIQMYHCLIMPETIDDLLSFLFSLPPTHDILFFHNVVP
ncbi:hypothetical protein BD560DRAFT_62515 [Blakeslea trispora]|nr:hypothetical protein BD560DRAFT_62515 [Blakeslea trispora]